MLASESWWGKLPVSSTGRHFSPFPPSSYSKTRTWLFSIRVTINDFLIGEGYPITWSSILFSIQGKPGRQKLWGKKCFKRPVFSRLLIHFPPQEPSGFVPSRFIRQLFTCRMYFNDSIINYENQIWILIGKTPKKQSGLRLFSIIKLCLVYNHTLNFSLKSRKRQRLPVQYSIKVLSILLLAIESCQNYPKSAGDYDLSHNSNSAISRTWLDFMQQYFNRKHCSRRRLFIT